MDLLLHIPELLENITTFRNSPQSREELLETVRHSQLELSYWWYDWLKLNPNPATTVKLPQNDQVHQPFINSYMSSGLRMNTTQQAMELICYHSAMCLLGQLESVLRNRNPEQDIVASIMLRDDLNSRTLLPNQANALFLPREIEGPWQHGLEGLRILAGFCNDISSGPELYLAFAPLAILYCFSRYLGIQEMMLSMISGEQWMGDAEEEFRPYRLDLIFPDLWVLDVSSSDQAPLSDGKITAAKELFINTSWP